MINTLTALTVSYLKLPRTLLAAVSGADDEPEATPELGSSEFDAEGHSTAERGAGQIETWDPDMREIIRTEHAAVPRPRPRRQRDSVSLSSPLPVVNPKNIKAPEPIEAGKRASKKRHGGERRIRRI